jgi:aspartate/glutamate racemase
MGMHLLADSVRMREHLDLLHIIAATAGVIGSASTLVRRSVAEAGVLTI